MSAGAGEASATLWVQGGQVPLHASEELLRLENGVPVLGQLLSTPRKYHCAEIA